MFDYAAWAPSAVRRAQREGMSGAMISTRATVAAHTRPASRMRAPARWALAHADYAVVPLAAFGIYWVSSLLLEAAQATIHFGSDAPMYAWYVRGEHWGDRLTRFHPVTIAMEVGWMQLTAPLAAWISPPNLLKAMFAAVGAVGAWAAMWALAAVAPRRYAALFGIVYAASLDVWYFSSIEESKIVTATLTGLYIALYLHLRRRWNPRGAWLLTAVLALACLNEIVSGFLVAIPAVDTLAQRGWSLRRLRWADVRWLAAQALTPPLVLLFLEGILSAYLLAPSTDPEGASHLSMLWYYARANKYDAWTLSYFLENWLLFNIAAPTPVLSTVFPHWPKNKYFAPDLSGYLSSPVSAALVVLFAIMLAAIVLRRYRARDLGGYAGLLLGLGAYALLRAIFFFIVYPYECLLFSSSVTLAHLLLLGIPFTASRFPAKSGLLAGIALLLFVTSGTFIVSQ
jgi:hypothetical protein